MAEDSKVVFYIQAPCGRELRVCIFMTFQMGRKALLIANTVVRATEEADRNRDEVWLITCSANGRNVQACWTKGLGDTHVEPPEVQVAYLPICSIGGMKILYLQPSGKWRADNSSLPSRPPLVGIAFRTRKDMRAKLKGNLGWGQEIEGYDDGDGWVRCVPGHSQHYAPRRDSTAEHLSPSDNSMPEQLAPCNSADRDFEESGEEDEEDNDEVPPDLTPNLGTPDALPQGVSFDSESGAYQATVRASKTGRFVFLGGFSTPAEAHQKYLEALPIYCPEKRVLPPIAA